MGTDNRGTDVNDHVENHSPDHESAAASVKDTVRNRFSSVAANYATSTVHAQGEELRAMLDLADLSGDERVLDAGCGPGHTALTFAPHVAQVIGVDLSAEMLEQGRLLAAKRQLANIEFRVGDVEQLPDQDDTFDVVVTRYSAHHWPAPERALAEFRRVLRSGGPVPGRLLVADVVSFPDATTDTHLQTMELLRDPSHVRDHTPEQWLAMLAHAGFQAEVAWEWSLPLDFDSWVQRMQTPATSVAVLRTVLAHAPSEVRTSLQIEPNNSFSFRCALFYAVAAP